MGWQGNTAFFSSFPSKKHKTNRVSLDDEKEREREREKGKRMKGHLGDGAPNFLPKRKKKAPSFDHHGCIIVMGQ